MLSTHSSKNAMKMMGLGFNWTKFHSGTAARLSQAQTPYYEQLKQQKKSNH